MKHSERFRRVMEYEEVDCPPFFEESVWPETLRRWHSEGLPEDRSWEETLGISPLRFYHHGFNHALNPPFTEKVLEEDDEMVLMIDCWGRTSRVFRNRTSMPEWLEFPVKSVADFEMILDRFDYDPEARLAPDWEERVRTMNSPDFDALVAPCIGNYYFTLSALAGVEQTAYLFMDAPRLIHEYMDRICRLCEWFLHRILSLVPGIFCLGTGEDLAYKNGPFFSPAVFKTFFEPRYRHLIDVAREYGVHHVFLDSDGNFTMLLEQMLDAGMTIFCPVEVASGMDPVQLRERFGRRLRMVGGVDKRIVAAGKDAIRREMDRLYPVVREGGFVPKIDHSVSSDISWDNFRYYIDALRSLYRRCAESIA
ncbi:MAG: hypothetical protein D6820_16135 [Lentisphaerae bacterium]|nr:MAG: hypothetical protein D6820_16135 [Lentisphaerota bacterium]